MSMHACATLTSNARRSPTIPHSRPLHSDVASVARSGFRCLRTGCSSDFGVRRWSANVQVEFQTSAPCNFGTKNNVNHKRGNWSRIDQLILRASVSLSWKSQCRCIGQFFENPAVNVVSSCALRHRAQRAERHNNLAIIPHAQRVSERTLEIRYRHTQGKNTP